MSMTYRSLSLSIAVCLMLVALSGWATDAATQYAGSNGYVYGDSATLTVSVLPLHAEVRLDGVYLGYSHDLMARALPMVPGDHVVEIWAEGYLPSVVSIPGTANWSTNVHLELVPIRQP